MEAHLNAANPYPGGAIQAGRRLHGLRRTLLVLFVALAGFFAAMMAAPEEASAHEGWHKLQFSDGNYHYCYQFWNGSRYATDGCEFVYGGYIYYEKYTTGEILIRLTDGTYEEQRRYWLRQAGFAPYEISFNTGSSANDLIPQLAGVTGTVVWSNRQAARSGPEEIPEKHQDTDPRPGSTSAGEPRAAEKLPDSQTVAAKAAPAETSGAATSARAVFPHKIAQDSGKSLSYDKGWRQVRTKKASGGSYRVSSSKSRIATFEATGTTDAGGATMEFITATGPKMGAAKVQVVNLAAAKVVKQVTFNLRTTKSHFNVQKKISGLTPHTPYGLVIRSANGRPVVVDAVGYRAHGNMCHSVYN